MKKYDVALFDVDGTLLYTKPGILRGIREMFRLQGLGELEVENEMDFCGPPIHTAMHKRFPDMSAEKIQECADLFRSMYKEDEYLLDAEIYDGIIELIKELKKNGVKIAVATYKREDYAISIVNHFGIGEYADVIHGSDGFGKLTKADIIRLCMTDLGYNDMSKGLMIGDSNNDAIGAKDAEVPFLAVNYGFGFKTKEDVDEYPNVGMATSVKEILNYFI